MKEVARESGRQREGRDGGGETEASSIHYLFCAAQLRESGSYAFTY